MPPDPELVRSDFIIRFMADLERGSLRTHAEYLDLYPGCEAIVSEEWDRLSAARVEAGPLAAPSRKPVRPQGRARMIGPYRVERELGRGGQGTVYEAVDVRLDRRVALKVLKPSLSGIDALVRRFEQEARLLARLDHPGIAGIHDAGSLHGLQFIAMRYVEGTTLAREIEGRGPVAPDREAIDRHCAAIEAAARALHIAHEAGVVHRDVKPGNVMITPEGRAVILDFGLARLREAEAGSMTATGDLLGTPAFMAPEQVAGKWGRIDRRADVFGLGATLHEAVAGPGAAVRGGRRPSARRINPAVARDLDAVLRVALDPDPERRYRSAASFADDLARVRLGKPVAVRPPGVATRFALWCRRAPAAAALVVIPPVALAVTLAAFTVKNREVRAAGVAFEERKADADAAAAEAHARFIDFQRLNDLKRLEDLRARSALLWPAHPRNEAAMKAWLADARELAGRQVEHRRALDALRSRGRASTDREPGADPAADELLHLRRVSAAAGDAARLREGDAIREELLETARVADVRAGRLEHDLASRPVHRFERPEDQWLHDRLARLVLEIETLERGDTPDGTIASMTARIESAAAVERRSLVESAAAWASAIAEIGDRKLCPHYDGLVIAPVFGLVPIGRDPRSGLHEFAHLPSGDPPARDPSGNLRLTEGSSIVLVLVPGGRTRMGARKPEDGESARDHADPEARPPEQPVTEVELDPFFISKYEMTQGQWLRATGANPSHHRPGNRAWASGYAPNLRHPVEQVSYEECEDVLLRLGLTLPTEAQWERAARAGTTTPWWCGESPEAFLAIENLADRTANVASGVDAPDERRDDGWAGPAPVGTWPANPFGLHDVVGNVAEWCRDLIAAYSEPALPGDGLRCGVIEGLRVIRGGDYRVAPRQARSAYRYGANAASRDAWTGVRPGLPATKP